jgi:hypothetical protein
MPMKNPVPQSAEFGTTIRDLARTSITHTETNER